MRRALLCLLLSFGTVRLSADSVDDYVKRAIEYIDDELYLRALQELSSAISMMEWSNNFENMEPYLGMGGIYCFFGDYENSVLYYTKAIESIHSSPVQIVRALIGRCFSYGLWGDEDSCNADFAAIRDISYECDDFFESLWNINDDEDDDDDYYDDYDKYMLIVLKGWKG